VSTVFPQAVAGVRSANAGTGPSPALLGGLGLIAALALGLAAGYSPLYGAALLFACAGAAAVAVWPSLGLFVLVGIVPAVSGLRRGFPVPGFRLSELLIAGTSVVLLVVARRGARWTAFDWIAVVYGLAMFIDGLIDGVSGTSPLSTAAIDAIISPLQFLLLYRAVRVTVQDDDQRRRCVWLILGFGMAVALLALLQTASGGVSSALGGITDTSNGLGQTSAEVVGRATGPFGHWQTLAGYLTTNILLGAAVFFASWADRRRWILILILLVDSAGLIVTVSLGPIIGTVMGVCALAIWSRRGTRPVIGIAAACGVLGLTFEPLLSHRVHSQLATTVTDTYPAWVPQTLGYRYTLWTTVNIPSLSGHWLTGYGGVLPASFANFPFTESLYFDLLFRGGLILLAAYLLLQYVWISGSLRAARSSSPVISSIARASAVALIIFLPLNMIESYFLGSGVPHVLWSLAGLMGVGWYASTDGSSRDSKATDGHSVKSFATPSPPHSGREAQ
jgi:hypothetical protein